MKRGFLLGFLAPVLLFGLASQVWAEYPERPITLIANYSAGGGADLSARALAKKAEKALGQPVAVVNRAGAGGTVGMAAIAASKPDGYTIGVTTYGPLTFAPHMNDLPYDPLKDFEYIMGYGRYMYGPVARSDSQFKTLKDLVQYAKANPGKVKYSLIGLPTPNNFGMVYLAKAEGIKWEPVVFKETPAAVAACLGGHVDIVSQNPGDVVSYIKAGRFRLLASFSDIRWPWVPDVPTARELGYKFDVNSWLALGTPKGVPKPALDRLREAFKKAIDDPEFIEIMNKIYIPPAFKTPEEYKNLVEVGYKESEAMIRELGLHKSQQKK
jgi:tripartite-type tricarboxylate transporter receptor subunit TctC